MPVYLDNTGFGWFYHIVCKFIVYAAAAVNIMLLQCLQTPLITGSRRRLLVVKGCTNQQTLHPGSVIPGYRVENQHETCYFLRNIFRCKKYQIPTMGIIFITKSL